MVDTKTLLYESDDRIFDLLETLKPHFPMIAGGFARGTGGVDIDYIVRTVKDTPVCNDFDGDYSKPINYFTATLETRLLPLVNKVIRQTDIDHWKLRVNIYTVIQRRCDSPAYFWTCYRYKPVSGIVSYSVLEAIDHGHGDTILFNLEAGNIDPQEWCDNN